MLLNRSLLSVITFPFVYFSILLASVNSKRENEFAKNTGKSTNNKITYQNPSAKD
jgi:hypothetical protein